MGSNLISGKISKIILLIFAFLAIFIASLGLHIFSNENQQEILKSKSILHSISELKRDQILNWYKNKIHKVQEISGNSDFRKLFDIVINQTDNLKDQNLLKPWITKLQSNIDSNRICFINKSGKIQYQAGESNVLSNSEIFDVKNSLIKKSIIISNFIKIDKKIYLNIYSPITSHEGNQLSGVLLIRLDINSNLIPLLNDELSKSDYPKYILVQQNKNETYTIVNNDSLIKLLINFHWENIINKSKFNFVAQKINNNYYYFSSIPVTGTNWMLIDYVPEDYIVEIPFVNHIFTVTLIFILLLLTGFVLIKLLNNYFSINFKSFIEEASDGIFISDENGNYIHANKAACNLIGLPLESLIKLKVDDIIVKDDIDQNPLKLDQIFKGESVIVERKIKRNDGSILPVEVSAKSLPGRKVHAIVRDISTRLEYRNALEIQKEKYKSLIENINEIVYDLDADGNITWISPTISTMTSFPASEIIGKRFLDFVLEEDKPKAISEFELNKKGKNTSIEIRIKLNSGRIKWIRIKNVSIIENGNFLGTHGLIRDITDDKLSEERLKHSELQYRSLFENANDAILLIKSDKIIDCNSISEKLFRCNKEDLIKKTLKELSFVKQDNGISSDKYLEERIDLVKSGNAQIFPFVFKRFDNSSFDAEINIALIRINGNYIFQAVIRDITEKKKAELALIKSEEKYKQLIDQAADGIFIIDDEGNFLLVNDKGCEMLGYTKEEMTTLNIKDTFVQEYNSENIQKINNLKPYEILNFERLIKKKDNSAIPVEVRVKHLQKNWTQEIVRDISDRKKSEEILKESEERYRNMFHDNHSVMLLLDPESGEVLDANEAAVKFYGYPIDELKGFQISELSTLSKERIDNDFNEALRYQNNHFFSIHKSFDNKLHDVEIFSTPISINGKKVIFSIIFDVTEKIKTEERLRIINSAIEQNPVSIIITDSKGTIEYVNPKFCHVTGYTFEEVIGNNPRILKSGRMSQSDYKYLWKKISSGEMWKGEIQNKKKNGDYFWEYATIAPIKNINGEITKYVGIKEDITRQKRMIQELIEAKINAEEMNRLKTNFLTNMSHELRTPMIGILGYAELLKNELVNAEFKEMSETIYNSGKRLLDTLNLILDLSKVESSKMVAIKREIDVPSLILELSKLFLSAANNKNLYLQYTYHSNITNIKTDERLLRESLNNLINNAIKFTKFGGVKIEVSDSKEGEIDYLNISVKDTGIGIAPNEQLIIFEEFRQASEGFNRNFEGTGIGLTLTKKFIELIDGKIRVESIPGKGSTFSVLLPVEDNIASKNTKKSTPFNLLTENQNNKPDQLVKILMVENDEASRKVIKQMLKKFAEIDEVSDGISGVKKASRQSYDVILMDINLGHGINGLQATAEIRKLKAHKNTPIIAVTAFAMAGDKEEFLESGCTDYLAKPFSKDKLINVIQKNLNKKIPALN